MDGRNDLFRLEKGEEEVKNVKSEPLRHDFHRLLISKHPRDTLFSRFQNHLGLARAFSAVFKTD
jgi:hypothetical protein